MIRIEPRTDGARHLTYGIPILSAMIALALAAIPLVLSGAPLGQAYYELFKGVFGSRFAFSEMLTQGRLLSLRGWLRLSPFAHGYGILELRDNCISALSRRCRWARVSLIFLLICLSL